MEDKLRISIGHNLFALQQTHLVVDKHDLEQSQVYIHPKRWHIPIGNI